MYCAKDDIRSCGVINDGARTDRLDKKTYCAEYQPQIMGKGDRDDREF